MLILEIFAWTGNLYFIYKRIYLKSYDQYIADSPYLTWELEATKSELFSLTGTLQLFKRNKISL